MGVFDKVKAAAGAIASKAGEVLNLGLDKLKATIDDITAAAPSLKEVGYTIEDIELNIGLAPSVKLHLERDFAAEDEAFQAILLRHKDNKTLSTIVHLLKQANYVYGKIPLKDREFKHLELDLGLPPAFRMRYVEGPEPMEPPPSDEEENGRRPPE